MTDNTQATIPSHPPQPPEFHSPPPPPGDPPITAATSIGHPDQATTQPATAQPGQYAPPAGPPPGASALAPASATSAQPSTDPFSDASQTTAAAPQLTEPPQHPDRPLPTGPLTETPLHSEPAPILPPRPQPAPEPQTPPPPRASFDQIPDHPALRQSSLGRAQSPTQSVQRVAMTPVQPQPVPPPPQAPVLDANANTLESDPAIASLRSMFPAFDLLVLQSVLEATGGDRDQAIDSLLAMSDPDYAPAQPQPAGGGAPNQGRQPTQTELDEEFARRLMLEEEQQAHGGAWPPQDPQAYQHNVPYQTYQPRRSGEHHRPTGSGGGGIGDMANDLQQQFRSFIGGAGGRGTGSQGQQPYPGQASTGTGVQEQFNKFADTGKKTFNSIFNKVKQKMEEFDKQHPPDTQNMNRPPQSGHWSNWQAPSPGPAHQPPQHAATYAQSPAPGAAPPIPAAQSPPPAAAHGALNSNPYGAPPTNANADANAATLPTSSGRWQYQPEPGAASAQPQAPATGAGAPEPKRSIDAARLGLLPKRPVSLMDVNANTRPPAAQAPAASHATERDSDEESLEYVDRPMPGGMGRP
ncbi:hypothetical protein FRC07_003308 [Ceratobasidium sp. 392]|nr:hypothetical protein FRC07_003308 [Ceratobasidium sp. 392]